MIQIQDTQRRWTRFSEIRDAGSLKGEIAIIVSMLGKYNPTRIFTEYGNPDITLEGEEVPLGDFLITSKYKRESCLNKYVQKHFDEENNKDEASIHLQDRCRCTKSTCMKDIIETASKYFKHVLDAFHDIGEPNKECETKSFDMLDTHLDILGLIPPLQGFKHDYLKMLINIKQGYDLIESKESKEKHDSELSLIQATSDSKPKKPKDAQSKDMKHHVDEVNRYYESALADFVASVPLFAWSGPFARAMRLEKDELLDEGPMTELKEAILEAVVKNGGDLMSVTKPLEQMMSRFGNAITYANAEAISWVDRVSNQTVEDSDSDKINIDNIANSMFEVLIRFGCTDYKEMKEINKAINGVHYQQ